MSIYKILDLHLRYNPYPHLLSASMNFLTSLVASLDVVMHRQYSGRTTHALWAISSSTKHSSTTRATVCGGSNMGQKPKSVRDGLKARF